MNGLRLKSQALNQEFGDGEFERLGCHPGHICDLSFPIDFHYTWLCSSFVRLCQPIGNYISTWLKQQYTVALIATVAHGSGYRPDIG